MIRRRPRPRFAEGGRVEPPRPEWIGLPCGRRMGYIPAASIETPHSRMFTDRESWAAFQRDVRRHENRCPVCYPTVSHPDFDLEWTT